MAVGSLFLLSGCSGLQGSEKKSDISSVIDDEGKISRPLDIDTDILDNPKTEYDHSLLLVKTSATSDSGVLTDEMRKLGIVSLSEIAPRSEWKKAVLEGGKDARSCIKSFRNSGLFEMVDFDYIYENQDEGTEVVTPSEPVVTVADYQKQVNVDKAWKWMEDNGHTAGGDSSVVVAVIDTGVDYNHIDLKQNIWINKGEIPGNGIDDDGNGYVDDVNGWNCVGNNNDPMDDNGHGTHVAGIIGAANNSIGVTGVAYNCKIMPVKAGNSSGYFESSDIASAITYAYMNGADVINMSFGGTSVTMAVQEALEKAYTSSFLVAAAGNDGLPNERVPGLSKYETIYPASFSYVDGVMSVNGSNVMSSFTNWDPNKENKIEYECLAPGESIESTFPSNKYARLSGTSMAAPVVSGIAALLRSVATDKTQFPSKYLMSQLVNTSETSPIDFNSSYGPKGNGKAKVVDAYTAFADTPKPDVSLYDWYTFDGKDIDPTNNGNDNLDAGETIHIGTELLNRGGMAKNVSAKIDVNRLGGTTTVDSYVEIVTDTVNYSDIGTYSIRDAEKVMNSDTVVDVKKPFVIKIKDDVPNNYKCDINIHVSWNNGLDVNDTTLYTYDSVMTLDFHRGVYLPARINEDMTLTADKLWIVSDTVIIGEGVTVNVNPGTMIQFYGHNQGKYQYASLYIGLLNGASLNLNGTADKMINIFPADGYEKYIVTISKDSESSVSLLMKYSIVQNFSCSINEAEISNCKINYYNFGYEIVAGAIESVNQLTCNFDKLESTYMCFLRGNVSSLHFIHIEGKSINNCIFEYPSFNDSSYYYYQQVGIVAKLKCNQNVFVFNRKCKQYYIWVGDEYTTENGEFIGNVFINNIENTVLADYSSISFIKNKINHRDNVFYGYPKPILDHIFAVDDQVTGTGSISSVWPFVSGYQFTNDNGEETTKFSNEIMNLKLMFNRSMDTTENLSVKFGSVEPYADYIIDGSWSDDYTWTGKCQIPTAIENGTQRLNVTGGRSGTDLFMNNVDNCGRFTFDIDTTSAMAMNMFANATKEGIQLQMKQDDYDTIMGYNIYRSDSKDGKYAKINTQLVIPENAMQDAEYLDTMVEPGKTYYYSYTAVMTDFSESHASGRTSCAAFDSIDPIGSHTPVNQGYLGTNLNINCVIRDNVGVDYARLYYRVKGSTSYKSVDMVNSNDKYSGIIQANELSVNGMEYYIEVSDGTNVIYVGSGSKDSPYEIIIKESSEVSYLGDVDGNGIIEAVDAMLILQHINGKRVLVNGEFDRADLNGNDKLESMEALAILQYVNGNRTNLNLEA